jgi:lipid A 3-O-deacylase
LSIQTDPMAALGRVAFGAAGAVEADSDGDAWMGVGPYAMLALAPRWRLSLSVMAGAYARGEGEDLGSPVEFRTRLGIGRAVGPTWRVGLAAEHKSNAGIGEINPGVETVLVTLGRRF